MAHVFSARAERAPGRPIQIIQRANSPVASKLPSPIAREFA